MDTNEVAVTAASFMRKEKLELRGEARAAGPSLVAVYAPCMLLAAIGMVREKSSFTPLLRAERSNPSCGLLGHGLLDRRRSSRSVTAALRTAP
jgi:hypothetical protein